MEQQKHSGILLVTWPHDSNTDERERDQWDIQPLWGIYATEYHPLWRKKENVRLVFSVIDPTQVHISLSQHCGIGRVENQFGKMEDGLLMVSFSLKQVIPSKALKHSDPL